MFDDRNDRENNYSSFFSCQRTNDHAVKLSARQLKRKVFLLLNLLSARYCRHSLVFQSLKKPSNRFMGFRPVVAMMCSCWSTMPGSSSADQRRIRREGTAPHTQADFYTFSTMVSLAETGFIFSREAVRAVF